jgi:hypothetical protein
MKKLRKLFIVASLIGTFYLSVPVPNTRAASDPCYDYNYPEGRCEAYGTNCESGAGYWCIVCNGAFDCYLWD